MFEKPFFDPSIVVLAAVRIFPSPAGIVFGFEGSFTGRDFHRFLAVPNPWIGPKGGMTIPALFPFHPGPLSELE